ncbi:unnamed protein product [Cylindrotheca closterium]|uniref:Uncharacterized protein n=1 Tax=Cylindrotheca closterium TaxID=2856 RepID=A0AAD2GBU8_9STRA|nr:unnamed protein product [Cylindrotheca closterium]
MSKTNVAVECQADDGHPGSMITKKNCDDERQKKVRFFFNSDNMDEDGSRNSNVSKFSLKAMRDEVSSKLKFSSNERDAPPTILEETGFELLPNCDDNGNSSITIARAENDFLNRIPPLRTRKAKMRRMFKRNSKMEVISTICERDDGSTISDNASYSTLEVNEVCRKIPSTARRIKDEAHYQPNPIDSKDIDDNQWKELFVATEKMVNYFLGQQMEEEAKELVRPIGMEPIVHEVPKEPQQQDDRWRDVARRRSYKTIRTLKIKAKELPMKVKWTPMPKPILKTKSLQKLIPRRESFILYQSRPTSEIEFESPVRTTANVFQPSVDKYDTPEESNSLDEEVAMAIETFRVHAKRLGVNEMELMNAVQHDERSQRPGFIAADHDTPDDGTIITYGTTRQHNADGEIDEDENTVYTRSTLETYAPTVADTEYSPYTLRESDENLFMVSLLDVFDYFFVPYP